MNRVSAMDVYYHGEETLEQKEEEEDPFLNFIDYARSELLQEEEEGRDSNGGDGSGTTGPGWSWIVSRILKTCGAYSSGVTSAILLSELSQAWNEQRRVGAPKKRLELINQLKKNHRRTKLPNTVTIDSIYEKNFLSLNSVLEVVIIDAFVLPGTDIHMLTLGDYWSSNIIDLYLHRRLCTKNICTLEDIRIVKMKFQKAQIATLQAIQYSCRALEIYHEIISAFGEDTQSGILKKGREVFLTGCYLRTATEGSGYPRLLPTEYLVIILDENQDDDAMLLGCSDSFSSISLDAVNKGVSYSLYARIESIESTEVQGMFGSLQRKQITLVDGDDFRLKLLLWGEQSLLVNLFRVGSMLALEKPYISSSIDCGIETSEEFFLEYGSATQLYLVPYMQHEEQVCITLTQNCHQSSRLSSSYSSTQGPKFSQVSLPRGPQGTIDFSNCPFQSFVADLQDKMIGISLYGVVTDIIQEDNTEEIIFSLRIVDTSGAIWAKLHFARSWSLGRLSLGHTIFISGLACSMSKQKRLEVSWFENESGASFINLSCLPALLNSSCLHKLSRLSDISSQTSLTRICRVWLDPIEHYNVNTSFSHSLCGHFVNKTPSASVECGFCHTTCDAEVVRSFQLKITLADETAKVLAWCSGQTAMDLLQISPEEFFELPEDEQVMYPSSLENERFMVALVNCRWGCSEVTNGFLPDDAVTWEITRAYNCE